ncbi:MAG TPA: methyltransferase domain-containing protein [Verrucomicrobiae bacterium]|nr:methyltransferase domain-containing protein [Verrucomicrobiae bacterium]
MPAKQNSLKLFLAELAKYPRQMGTVWPSSPALAEAMASWLPASQNECILELGPGTGIVTEKLLAAGLPEERLIAVEKSPRLAGFLQEKFPRARIVCGDALQLHQILPGQKFGGVFSSLPLKVFSDDQVRQLSELIHAALLPDAPWVQYSYQLINGHAPTRAFHAVDSQIVWQNLPPAKVSVYRARPRA